MACITDVGAVIRDNYSAQQAATASSAQRTAQMKTSLHTRPQAARLQCMPFRPAKSIRAPARCGPATPSDDANAPSRLSRRETLGVAAAGAVAAAGISRSTRVEAAAAAPAAASPATEPGVGGSSKQQTDRIELGRSGALCAHAG